MFVIGCGASPTEPNGPSTAPRVDAISPTPLVPSPVDQILNITGLGFLPGLSVTLTDPTGSVTIASGGQIRNLTTNSFDVILTLPMTGVYLLVVNNSSGLKSATVSFTVFPSGQSSPAITSVVPNPVLISAQPSLVTITGARFDLTVSVRVIDPLGAITDYGPTAVVVVPTTTIQFSYVFNTRGTYQFTVTNGQGQISNVALVTAN